MKKTVFLGEAKVTYKEKRNPVEVKIRSSRDVYMHLKSHLKKELLFEREHFVVMYLNTANTIMWIETVSVGTSKSCTPDSNAIVRRALTGTSTAVIVAHNHPSGNKMPSENDRRYTKELKEKLKVFEIPLLDHLILTKNEYYSFSDNGERSVS